jgi:signal transduction histidine kinase
MDGLLDSLRVVQAMLFVVLGGLALVRWARRRDAAGAWLAVTFGDLATISLVGLVLPQEPELGSPEELATRALVALLVLFPYFLFRFGASFQRQPRALEVVAGLGTVGIAAASFLLPTFPRPGEAWPTPFAVWAVLLVVQWVALATLVAVELWRAGRGQPTVSRLRMRVMSLGAIALALTLVLSASVGGADRTSSGSDLALQLFSLTIAPLFLVGFAPPSFLLAAWRRPELEDLRAAEEVLLQALSPADVGARLLPHVTRIIGGTSSALFDREGTLLGVDGIGWDEARARLGEGPTGNGYITLPVRAGRLVVGVSPYTPYFAGSEAQLLTRLATFTDLALSRAELSERERQTAVELQASNEAMREFVAIASHDLRTPVTVIKGFAATLESDWANVTDEQRRQYLATIRRHAEHLGVIIDDLLTTSRVDAGVLVPNAQQVEVGAFLGPVVADLDRGDEVVLDVEEGLLVHVDREHLQRMVTNYLVNAWRYGEPPVTLRARRAGGTVEIVVCDAGPGVPEEFESRIFEKFARVDKRHSREHHGTGLGLAIVKGLARAAGGDAWYERNEPRGACFGIRLPTAG